MNPDVNDLGQTVDSYKTTSVINSYIIPNNSTITWPNEPTFVSNENYEFDFVGWKILLPSGETYYSFGNYFEKIGTVMGLSGQTSQDSALEEYNFKSTYSLETGLPSIVYIGAVYNNVPVGEYYELSITAGFSNGQNYGEHHTIKVGTDISELVSLIRLQDVYGDDTQQVVKLRYSESTVDSNKNDLFELTTMPKYNLYLIIEYELIKSEYIIKYYDGNTEYTSFSTSVFTGDYLKFPETPVKSGYKFSGWYIAVKDEDGNLIPGDTVFNENIAVSSNLSLIAKWRLVGENLLITIKNYYEDGSDYQIMISEDETIILPTSPYVNDGYEWDGKYYISGTNIEFKELKMGSTDITLVKGLTKILDSDDDVLLDENINIFDEKYFPVLLIGLVVLFILIIVITSIITTSSNKRYRRRKRW